MDMRRYALEKNYIMRGSFDLFSLKCQPSPSPSHPWVKETADISDYNMFLVHVPNLLNLFLVILGCKPYSIVKKKTTEQCQ